METGILKVSGSCRRGSLVASSSGDLLNLVDFRRIKVPFSSEFSFNFRFDAFDLGDLGETEVVTAI
jgi:hypothetical protein